MSGVILFIIPGFIAAVMRNGGGRKKSKAQMAADTLCYSLVILTIVSGMLYVFLAALFFLCNII